MHIISLNLSVWTIVCISVDFRRKMKNQDLNNFNKFIAILKQHLRSYPHGKKDEFDRINGLKKVKNIWDTLQRAHEGIKPVKKAKMQLVVEGQLDRFVMLDDESPQEIFN
jgi:esterase/lipase